MENQLPAPQPVPPVPTPVVSPKPAFGWGIVILVIAVIVFSAGITFFLVKGYSVSSPSQTKPTPTAANNLQPTQPLAETTNALDSPTPVIVSPTNIAVSPTGISSCDVSDNTFCAVLADLKSALSANNYAGFLAYQNLQSITCDPDGMFVAICEGVAKGTVKQGYGIGYNQSEGTFVAKNDYVTSVLGYVNSNGPFIYRGSLVSEDKGVAVFLNAKKDHLLVFPLLRSGASWRMNTLLLGGTFGDSSFDNLSNSLLDFVR